jgi:hypothetical protein
MGAQNFKNLVFSDLRRDMFFDNTLSRNTINGRYIMYLSIVAGKKMKTIESSSERKSRATES